jgi:hypothetical protein
MRCCKRKKYHAASLRYSKMNMYHGLTGCCDTTKKVKPLEMRFNLTESINSVLPLTDNPN